MDTRTLSPPADAPRTGASRLGGRFYGPVNWLGLRTLIAREIQRFWKVSAQTLVAPLMQTLLYLAVFAVAWGERAWGLTAAPYVDGLVPGLAMMAIISNAFQNSASSIVIAKVQGNAVDFLMPPISAFELTTAFILGASARGLMVGLVSILVAAPFAHIAPANIFVALYFAAVASVIFGAIGLIGGIWADKFDHLAAVTNFVVTPLMFLSGTFYSIDALPEPARTIGHYNPVFFLIDGFRAGFIGHADAPLATSALASGLVAAALVWTCWALLNSGWRLKA